MLIRRERPEDHVAIGDVLAAAFADAPGSGGDVPVEVGLVDALRASPEWIAPLALVAEGEGGEVAGYVVCTRGWVGERLALGLGPLAVAPAAQRLGAGSALMHAVLGAADALGGPRVALLGHTGYYPRFGFRPAAELGVEAPEPEWGAHFQARPLTAYDPAMRGTFRYAQPFLDL
jgi:putative acetyltransferase